MFTFLATKLFIGSVAAGTTAPRGREITTDATVVTRGVPGGSAGDAPIRVFKDDVLAHFGNPLLDVRSSEECSGECTSMSVYPFTARDELDAIYRGEAVLTEGDNVIAVSLYRRAFESHLVRADPLTQERGGQQL
ncbi:hypothetical protein [Cryobacterium sp. Y62]|uniref:hypothetical protein n=1 Tax=Cryobacterium sp. Y62 TaxID=2048284 RepID=UPI000CE344D7|nr:hypothetical protein [Cryobacterium sp. Y62]